MRKAQEWGGIISEVKKNIDLNKIQRSNGECHRTKSFSKGKMIRNDKRYANSLHPSAAVFSVNRGAKAHAG